MPRSKGTLSFNPLKQTQVPLGQSKLARDARTSKASAQAEAEWLARHFQLDAQGRLDSSESGEKLTKSQRDAKHKRLTDFPRIPEGELQRLEEIIKRYGLPLAALSSDTAAFVVRRVMLDYWRLSILRRRIRPPMFTPEELVALLQEMNLQVAGLADLLTPDRKSGTNNMLWRWIHGVNAPSGTVALRVNRLIEQHVRRKKRTDAPPSRVIPGRRGAYTSTNPSTVARRQRKWRRSEIVTDAPTTRAARKEEDGG